ncbi:MAG: hypothetical protein A2452_00270 [Candidatus Firestonebacteria bacterium RIFOXYC2_FULL_39_67]|nr:MAG: hypothetical protein A2536_05975 [Candidatus Firestonebacteria bacterium RIFOXYD2_FULL_39_29]OGF54238.1 MAG: hypothetical protein A2452_00270 [Candidatus Firestonebacteria bacterium RIFOXYC2_FULL_39_67]
MKKISVGLFLCLAASVLAAPIPLKVDFGQTEWAGVYPVRSGVPIARGKVTSIDSVGVLAGKTEIPCQVKPIAFWPDKSFKWISLDFIADSKETYSLNLERKGSKPAVLKPVKTTRKKDGSLEVNTGVVKFEVNKTGSGFIDKLWLDSDGDGKYADSELVVKPEDAEKNFMNIVSLNSDKSWYAGNWSAKGKADNSKVIITKLEVEEDGPVHTVILIKGYYKYKLLGSKLIGDLKRRGECDFVLRVHAYAGSGLIGCQHWYVYEGASDFDMIRNIGLSVGIDIPKDTVITTPTIKEIKPGEFPSVSLFIEDADTYKVWGNSKAGISDVVLESGSRPLCWLDVSNSKYGVTLGVRKGWQSFPKSVWVDSKTGKLTVNIWPPESGLLDYRRYTREWNTGETGARGGVNAEYFNRNCSKGTSKTTDVFFYFHAGNTKQANSQAVASAFDAFPIIHPGPDYYAGTRALGYYRPYDPKKFPTAEKLLGGMMDYYLDSQEKSRWYGMFDYGDVMWWMNQGPKTGRWALDIGRWAWLGGDDSGPVGWFFLFQYIRTGQRRDFELGEANVKHVQDVDTINTEEYPWDWGPYRNVSGCAHRHNVSHWGCAYIGARGGTPAPVRDLYYLMADGRLKDILDRDAISVMAWQDGEATRFGHSSADNSSESGAHSSQALLTAWERTLDEKYIKYLMNDFTKRIHVQDRACTGFGGMGALMEYYDLTGDAKVKEIIKMHADKTKPGSDALELSSVAWRTFKDEKYLNLVQNSFGGGLGNMSKSPSNILSKDVWPGRPGDISPFPIFSSTEYRGLAFAMEALYMSGKFESKAGGEK